jgi:hypothetical protein
MRDRLVKEMRLAGIESIAAANHFLMGIDGGGVQADAIRSGL